MKVLPGVWNYRTKRDENGNIVKHKARWCVNGSIDKFTWPPEAIYSPVAEISTVRLVFVAAAATGQVVLQADFPNAYLNAAMTETVYVCQPYGIYNGAPGTKVCLLKKALYGCPVSGKKWHDEIASKIKTLGYNRSVIDHCLFSRETGGYTDLLLIYVDDLLVTSPGGGKRTEKQLRELENLYDVKRLGKATHMLGIGVHQTEGYITLEQQAYVEKIITDMEYEHIKPRGTPWDSQYVGKDDLLDETYTVLFRRVLGQLMYLANCTRPDLSFAVGRLASCMKTPCHKDWERIKRLLKYINGTKNYGLTYRSERDSFKLHTFEDAAYGVDAKRGRSMTGYVVHLVGAPILWRSHLQTTVADSPNASEYIALYEAAVATVGVQNLADGLGIKIDHPPTLYEDNDGVRRLATSGMGQKKARHLMMKLHYVQDLCEKGRIDVVRLAGRDQPADLLTKGSHTVKQFTYLRGQL
ncbi:MAG: hypothetical protein GY696_24775, partial [Gammaproteobacteria bacterium]|nr:hypothetical protein [Gammaproteobacteria bacterium]